MIIAATWQWDDKQSQPTPIWLYRLAVLLLSSSKLCWQEHHTTPNVFLTVFMVVRSCDYESYQVVYIQTQKWLLGTMHGGHYQVKFKDVHLYYESLFLKMIPGSSNNWLLVLWLTNAAVCSGLSTTHQQAQGSEPENMNVWLHCHFHDIVVNFTLSNTYFIIPTDLLTVQQRLSRSERLVWNCSQIHSRLLVRGLAHSNSEPFFCKVYKSPLYTAVHS